MDLIPFGIERIWIKLSKAIKSVRIGVQTKFERTCKVWAYHVAGPAFWSGPCGRTDTVDGMVDFNFLCFFFLFLLQVNIIFDFILFSWKNKLPQILFKVKKSYFEALAHPMSTHCSS